MTLRVIGTGFGRTGTDSMREALDMLGLGPCHHMREVIAHEEQKRLWRALAQGAVPDWERLFHGYDACVDWPSAHYWRELVLAFPEAKVILTHRSAESWWASFEQTILLGIQRSTDPQSLVLALIRDTVFGGRPEDKSRAMAIYDANVRAVRETVPRERLLVHELGDGWESLCAHLGVPVPAEPYPSANGRNAFRDTFWRPRQVPESKRAASSANPALGELQRSRAAAGRGDARRQRRKRRRGRP